MEYFSRLQKLLISFATPLAIFSAVLFISAIASPLPAGPAQGASVISETVRFDSGGFNIEAFVAKPSEAGKHPAVLVIHDSMGLDDSMREIAKQFAAAGFVVLAPDFTSRLGGTRTHQQMTQAVAGLSPNITVQDSRAALDYLQKDADVDAAKISTVGFGWGGWRSFMLAASTPQLYRAVIYCGTAPSQSFDAVHAAILAHYAQYDFRTTGNALVTEKEMAEAGRHFSYFVYPQAYRAFYIPGTQYNAEAAKLAWTRTLGFLRQ